MTGRPDCFMPFYVGDYLRDTLRLTTQQHGAYLLLLCAYWADGRPLHDDDVALAAITKLSPGDWKRVRPVLGCLPFFDVKDGLWHQKRADKELASAVAAYQRRKDAGAKGNASPLRPAKRNAKRAQSASQSDGNASATTLSSPSGKERVARAAARDQTAAPPAATAPSEQGWEKDWPRWADFRAKLHPNQWLHIFQNSRLNGSELSLIVDSQFEEDQIRDKWGDKLLAHFGEPVTVKLKATNDAKGRAA